MVEKPEKPFSVETRFQKSLGRHYERDKERTVSQEVKWILKSLKYPRVVTLVFGDFSHSLTLPLLTPHRNITSFIPFTFCFQLLGSVIIRLKS